MQTLYHLARNQTCTALHVRLPIIISESDHRVEVLVPLYCAESKNIFEIQICVLAAKQNIAENSVQSKSQASTCLATVGQLDAPFEVCHSPNKICHRQIFDI